MKKILVVAFPLAALTCISSIANAQGLEDYLLEFCAAREQAISQASPEPEKGPYETIDEFARRREAWMQDQASRATSIAADREEPRAVLQPISDVRYNPDQAQLRVTLTGVEMQSPRTLGGVRWAFSSCPDVRISSGGGILSTGPTRDRRGANGLAIANVASLDIAASLSPRDAQAADVLNAEHSVVLGVRIIGQGTEDLVLEAVGVRWTANGTVIANTLPPALGGPVAVTKIELPSWATSHPGVLNPAKGVIDYVLSLVSVNGRELPQIGSFWPVGGTTICEQLLVTDMRRLSYNLYTLHRPAGEKVVVDTLRDAVRSLGSEHFLHVDHEQVVRFTREQQLFYTSTPRLIQATNLKNGDSYVFKNLRREEVINRSAASCGN